MSGRRAVLRSRLFRRLFAGVVATVVAVVAAQLAVVLPRMRADSRDTLRERLLDHARLARAAVRAASRGQDAGQVLGELARAGGVRFTLLSADGSVIADSESNGRRIADRLPRPELLDAKATGLGIAVRRSEARGRDLMFVALPVDDLDAGPATASIFVRAALPLEGLDDRAGALLRSALWGAAAGLALGALGAALLARRATVPVLEVAEAAAAIAGGDYRRRIEIFREDEIGRVAAAFNETCQRLAEQLETITGDRNKLTAVLESMVEGVIAVDRHERIVHVNSVVAELFGLGDPERLAGRPFYEATRAPEIVEALEEALRGTRVLRTLRLEDRSPPRVLEVNAAPLRGAGQQTIGAVVVLHDVTRLHQLEGMRRELVSNVSHELKTPLTAIRGFVETLLDTDDIDDDTRRRFLERIRLQATRLSSLVSDLLSLSRVENANGGSDRRRIDLRAPMMESVRALRPAAESRGVGLEVDLPPGPVLVHGEEESLQQAFSNLIDNAIKYSEEGRPVWVRLREESDIGVAVFEVEDRGVGIDPRHHERIFERFYRVDKARSRDVGGTGLGLAIVKNVAQAFGGEVGVESRPGEGSLFRIRLPLASDTSGA